MKVLKKGFYVYLCLICFIALLLSYWLLSNLNNYGVFLAGNRSYKCGDYGEAEIKYSEIRFNNLEKPIASYNLGNTYYQQGRYLIGIKYYHLAIANSNDKLIKEKAWYNLGLSYFRINKLTESVEAFKRSFLLQPSNKQTRLNLIYATQQLGVWQKKQLEKNKTATKENSIAKNHGKDGEKEKNDNVNTVKETESMLNMVLIDEQRKRNKIGKIKRKLNNLNKNEKDY